MSGHRRLMALARDRIVSRAMIGTAAFILLKTRGCAAKAAKQAEL